MFWNLGGGSVRVQFIGMIEQKTSGCSSCGRRKTTNKMVRSKRFMLPSGKNELFTVTYSNDVSEDDADFLLSMVVDGKQIFKEV